MPRLSPSSTNNRRRIRDTILLIAVSFLASHLLFLLLPQVLKPWEAQLIDRLFRLRSHFQSFSPSYDKTVVHVDINNSTIQRLNNFYLNRSQYARVVGNLAAMGVSLQMYDFIFAARTSEQDDGALIDATRAAGSVYYGMALALAEGARDPGPEGKAESARYLEDIRWSVSVEGDASRFYTGLQPLPTFPSLTSAARGLGFLSIKPDADGVFRRLPLLVRSGEAYLPSLPFRAVCDYLGVPPERIRVRPGRDITLKQARRPGKAPADIVIPIDRHGNMLINFVGPWERMKHYNFADILGASENRDEMEMWHEELKGKIVLISDVSTGSTDIGPVPTDTDFPLSGLHTNVVHTILTGQFLREPSPTETALMDLLLMGILLLFSLRLASFALPAAALLALAAYVGMAVVAFLTLRVELHLLLPSMSVGLATMLVASYRHLYEEKEKAVLLRTFEAYFPPSVVKKIMANPEIIGAVSQKKVLTIMFSDIKDFSSYAASLPPDKIQKYLNEYFEAMVEIVFTHEGTVDKYIGDGLMVFFGDPEPQPDHALRCVRAAVEMQKRVRRLQDRWVAEGGFPICVRIGINTGEVVVGNMGSTRRLSYTVLGSAVNLAQRLESNAPVGGIMIAQSTYDLVKEAVATRPLGEIQVKGVDAPVRVYEVLNE